MKKILACTVAAIIAASMMTACGGDDDSSSKATASKADTTSSAAAEESAADESAAEESKADTEESAAEESTADESSGDGEEAAKPKPISEMPATLQDLETASLAFTTDMDPADFVKAMNESNFENDESNVEFTIEEVEGVPMLRCQVLDLKNPDLPEAGYKIPKIQFDVSKLFGGDAETIGKIFTVDVEFMTKAVGPFTADDGTESMVPGNFMGALVSQPGTDPDSLAWKELDSNLSEAEWTSEWATYKFTVRPGLLGPYEAVDTTQYFTFMRWSIPNQADFYIADITFKDEDGNVLACVMGANAK